MFFAHVVGSDCLTGLLMDESVHIAELVGTLYISIHPLLSRPFFCRVAAFC
ncbi:hypothetical protein KJZ99_01075 [bacterium]|nr:hypothetical protein [bacterium]